jgi:hypothetical protein
MSKKLLSEAQVRRFQNLASITPLQEMGNYSMKRDEEKPMEEELVQEEEVEEGMYKRDEEHMEAMHKSDEERMEEMYHDKEEKKMEEKMEDDGDIDVDMDADGDDDVEIEEEMVEKAAAALSDLQALLDALGGEAAMDDAPDMPAMDDAPEMEKDEDEPSPLEEDENAILELALEGIEYQPSQKEIIKEVAIRVARRLQEAKKAQANLNKALGKK